MSFRLAWFKPEIGAAAPARAFATVAGPLRIGTAAQLVDNLAAVRGGIAQVDRIIDGAVFGGALPTRDAVGELARAASAGALRDHGDVVPEQAHAVLAQAGRAPAYGRSFYADARPWDTALPDLATARRGLVRLATSLEAVQRAGGPEAVAATGGLQAVEGASLAMRAAIVDDGRTQVATMRSQYAALREGTHGIDDDVLAVAGRARIDALAEEHPRTRLMLGFTSNGSLGFGESAQSELPVGRDLRTVADGLSTFHDGRPHASTSPDLERVFDDVDTMLAGYAHEDDAGRDFVLTHPVVATTLQHGLDELALRPAITPAATPEAFADQVVNELAMVRHTQVLAEQLTHNARQTGATDASAFAGQVEALQLGVADRLRSVRAGAIASGVVISPGVARSYDTVLTMLEDASRTRTPVTSFSRLQTIDRELLNNEVTTLAWLLQHDMDAPLARAPLAQLAHAADVPPSASASAAAVALQSARGALLDAESTLRGVQGPWNLDVRLPTAGGALVEAERGMLAARPVVARELGDEAATMLDDAHSIIGGALDDTAAVGRSYTEERTANFGQLGRARAVLDSLSAALEHVSTTPQAI